jgi:hypothetical protein
MFTIETVKNIQWADEAHTMFNCLVKYAEFNEEHPVGVSPDDKYAHIQELWANGNAGIYGEIAEYVAPQVEVRQFSANANNETQSKGAI